MGSEGHGGNGEDKDNPVDKQAVEDSEDNKNIDPEWLGTKPSKN
jgi:hypothetical protein